MPPEKQSRTWVEIGVALHPNVFLQHLWNNFRESFFIFQYYEQEFACQIMEFSIMTSSSVVKFSYSNLFHHSDEKRQSNYKSELLALTTVIRSALWNSEIGNWPHPHIESNVRSDWKRFPDSPVSIFGTSTKVMDITSGLFYILSPVKVKKFYNQKNSYIRPPITYSNPHV